MGQSLSLDRVYYGTEFYITGQSLSSDRVYHGAEFIMAQSLLRHGVNHH